MTTNDQNNDDRGYEYSKEPSDTVAFTEHFDHTYTRIAPIYDWFVRCFPFWRRWLDRVLPETEGPRVLEVSFGTGYLLNRYAAEYEVHGVELNKRLLEVARRNLKRDANLVQGRVEDLPYPNQYFDSVVVTMAFTGYPDAAQAMTELKRVLKVGGKLILVDINYPKNPKNVLGVWLTKFWKAAGDLIRDMDRLFQAFDLDYTDEEIGGFGSVHLYVARKRK